MLLRNTDVFERWRRLGLNYMFRGMEALDEAGLDLFRKRVSPDENFQALEVARKIGLTVAINLIVSPDWDTKQFALVRMWALSVPEIVNLTVMTPYPGTEIWHTEAQKLTSLDYRLFDIQHAVLPTKLPLDVFYQELVKTQSVLNRKHLGVAAVAQTFGIIGRNLMHGQTNFARMLWKFNKVYNAPRQYGDHLASRLIAGWATAAPPSAERKDRTCSISSLVISVANALIFWSLKETWRPPVTPPWVPVPPRMLVGMDLPLPRGRPRLGRHRGRRDQPPHPTGTSPGRAVHRCGPRLGTHHRSHRPQSRSTPPRYLGRSSRRPPGVATVVTAHGGCRSGVHPGRHPAALLHRLLTVGARGSWHGSRMVQDGGWLEAGR